MSTSCGLSVVRTSITMTLHPSHVHSSLGSLGHLPDNTVSEGLNEVTSTGFSSIMSESLPNSFPTPQGGTQGLGGGGYT